MEDNTQSSETEKRGRGQPKADIDWKKVDDLLIAGCMGTGIAAYIGISPETLYDRCLIDKGKLFSRYSQEKKEKGDEILRAHQYAKAIGLTDKGDNTLLIWLGKTRLKQREVIEEKSDVTVSVIDYSNSNSEKHNSSVQVPAEGVSTSCSESA